MAVSIPTSGVKSNAQFSPQDDVLFTAHLEACSRNRLYYGDNLDALLSLTRDTNICGKVKLVYIDPPYSTGGLFQTRNLKHAYTDTLRGDDYLSFMSPRLRLLHQLLSEDGSIS